MLLASSGLAVAATTVAGTQLSAQAYADYTFADQVMSLRVHSNSVIAVVTAVEAFSLTVDASTRRAPGSLLQLPAVLANTGNVASDYTLSVGATGPDCRSAAVVIANLGVSLDANNNGTYDAAHPALTGANTVHLDVGQTVSLLLLGNVPAVVGQGCVALSVVTALQSVSAASTTLVAVDPAATLLLSQIATYTSPILPGSTVIGFQITAQNVGAEAAGAVATPSGVVSAVLVDGAPRSLLLIRSVLPAGTLYVSGSLQSTRAGALRLFRLPGDAPFSYRTAEDSSAIEVAIGLPSIDPQATEPMKYAVTLLVTAGTKVPAIASVAQAEYASATNVVSTRSNEVVLPLGNNLLGVALAAGTAMAQVGTSGSADGTAIVHLSARVRNYGKAPFFNLQIRSLLEGVGSTQFGSWTSQTIPGRDQYTVVANSIRISGISNSAVIATVNAAYSGASANGGDALLAAGAFLPATTEFTVQYDVRIGFVGRVGSVSVTAAASAGLFGSTLADVTDASVNGADPDPAGTGFPQLQSSPTVISLPPMLSLAGTASMPRLVSTGVYDLDYVYTIANNGSATAPHVRFIDNLDCSVVQGSKGTVASWVFTSAPTSRNGLLMISSAFTGKAACASVVDVGTSVPLSQSTSVTDGINGLDAGQTEVISFTIRVTTVTGIAKGQGVVSNTTWAASFADGVANDGSGGVIAATTAITDGLLVDPQGVVYDSLTRAPIAGAKVTLLRTSCRAGAGMSILAAEIVDGDNGAFTYGTDGSVNVITGSDGAYQFFWRAPPVQDICNYTVSVTPPAAGTYHTSTLIPVHNGVFTACGSVVANGGAPQSADPTTYYATISSGYDATTQEQCPVYHNNFPLDSASVSAKLLLTKEGNKSTAELGEFVDYKLTVTNKSTAGTVGIAFTDQLPPGFAYVKGSARFNGAAAADPVGGVGPVLMFGSTTLALASNASVSAQYRVRIGVGAPINGSSVNRAHANSGAVQSNEASWSVKVSGGVFSDDASLFGKVFLDCNLNGVQDDAGEDGIPGVRLFMEDGTSVITDAEGRWSLFGIKSITHVLKLDRTTLPAGAELELLDHRNAGAADSRFVDPSKGEFTKANFAVSNCDAAGLREEIATRHTAAKKKAEDMVSAVKARLALTADSPVTDVRGLPASGYSRGSGLSGDAVSVGRPLITLPDALERSGAMSSASASASVPANAAAPAATTLPDGAEASPAPGAHAPTELETQLDTQAAGVGFIEPVDGATMPTRTVNVRVKGPLETTLRLIVNGVVVPESRVGKKAALAAKSLAAWEYIGIELQPGDNRLELVVIDGVGVERETATIHLVAPDRLAAIVIDPVLDARADPTRPLSVVVHLTDAKGVPVTSRTQVTLETDLGHWLSADPQPDERGTQVFIEGGEGRFELSPPAEPGMGKIRVSASLVSSGATIDFLPSLRPMSGVGIVEGVIDLRGRGKVALGSTASGAAFEAELSSLSGTDPANPGNGRASGRSAFYFKGAVKGEYLLTTAFDSAKSANDVLFRDINPDLYYPIYGDSSVRGFDAQSTQKLYVRIDKNRSFLLYGDFTSASSPEVRQISQIPRSLTGVKQRFDSNGVRVISFASRSSSQQQVVEIPGTGLSLYFLPGLGTVTINSETIEVLVRSRSQAQVILSRRSLVRNVDYTIQLESRQILLIAPLASIDADLDPQSLLVSYEVDSGGPKYMVGGTDAQVKIGDHLQVGIVAAKDAAPDNQRRALVAATVLSRLGDATVVAGEVVRTESDDNGRGLGTRVELRHDSGALKAQVQVQRADLGFENPGATLSAGHTDATSHVEYNIDDTLKLKGTATFSKTDPTALALATQQKSMTVSVQKKLSDAVTAEFGLQHGNVPIGAGFDYGSVSGSTSVGAGATTATQPADSTTMRGRMTLRPPGLQQSQVYGEIEQDLLSSGGHAVALGGSYAITPTVQVYGRHEFDSTMYRADPGAAGTAAQYSTTVAGIESAYMEGGHVYSETRLGANGGQAAAGVRNTFKLSDSVRASAGFEKTRSIGAVETAVDATAVTLGIDYTATPWRASLALEARNGSDSDTRLLNVGVAYKLDDDWSLLTRSTDSVVDGAAAGRHVLARQQIGLAWRPVSTDAINALFRYENRYEKIGAGATGVSEYDLYGTSNVSLPGTDRVNIVTGLINVNPNRGDEFTGRYAAKLNVQQDAIVRSRYAAQLLHGRWTHDLGADWDVGTQAAVLIGQGGAKQLAAGVEGGYQAVRNLWISVGYNVRGLRDHDLAGDNYTARGAYLRMRFKFDETGLGFATEPGAGDRSVLPLGPAQNEAYRSTDRMPAAVSVAAPAAAPATPTVVVSTAPASTASAVTSAAPVPSVPALAAVAPALRLALDTNVGNASFAAWAPGQPVRDVVSWQEDDLFDEGTSTLSALGQTLVQALGEQLPGAGIVAATLSVGRGEQDESRENLWLARASALRHQLAAACPGGLSIEVNSAVAAPPEAGIVATPHTLLITVSGLQAPPAPPSQLTLDCVN